MGGNLMGKKISRVKHDVVVDEDGCIEDNFNSIVSLVWRDKYKQWHLSMGTSAQTLTETLVHRNNVNANLYEIFQAGNYSRAVEYKAQRQLEDRLAGIRVDSTILAI